MGKLHTHINHSEFELTVAVIDFFFAHNMENICVVYLKMSEETMSRFGYMYFLQNVGSNFEILMEYLILACKS